MGLCDKRFLFVKDCVKESIRHQAGSEESTGDDWLVVVVKVEKNVQKEVSRLD